MQEASHHRARPVSFPESTTGTPAPYGHACKNCAKAKCKCIYTQTGTDCERCCRLNKQCQPSVPIRRRNPKRSQPSRTAHLEEKLDDLVSLIRSQASRSSGSGDGAVAAANAIVAGTAPQGTGALTPSDSSPQGSSEAYGGTSTDKTSPAAATPNPEYAYPIDDRAAEERLDLFRRHMLSFGPAVFIPPTTTARDLQQFRPFLWLGILSCTSSSVKQAHAIASKMRTILANKIVLATERSLDLLQGLLVFLYWPQCQNKEKPFINMFTNLGITLVQDLGYTAVKGETAFAYSKKFWGQVRPQFPPERTVDDRRAALSMFVWHVMVSDILRLDHRLRWTPFMEESLGILQQQPEWEGDLILATQVRCSLVTQQLTEVVIMNSISGEKQIPMFLHKALVAQVHEIWRTLPANLAQHVLLFLHATEANIHELALAIEPATAPAEVVKRLEVLQQCCKSLTNWFEVFERIAPDRYVGITFDIYVQLLTNIIILSRLTSPCLKEMSAPSTAWDPTEIRKQFDLVALLDRLANNIDAAAVAIGVQEDEPGEESIWHKSSRSMRVIMKSIQEENANYATILPANGPGPMPAAAAAAAALPDQQQNLGPQTQPSGPHDPFLAQPFGDDPWMISSFFVPWDSMNF